MNWGLCCIILLCYQFIYSPLTCSFFLLKLPRNTEIDAKKYSKTYNNLLFLHLLFTFSGRSQNARRTSGMLWFHQEKYEVRFYIKSHQYLSISPYVEGERERQLRETTSSLSRSLSLHLFLKPLKHPLVSACIPSPGQLKHGRAFLKASRQPVLPGLYWLQTPSQTLKHHGGCIPFIL